MIIALTSDVYSKGQLYDAASTIMEQRLSQIQGVGQVSVGGSSLPAVRVEINPTQLNSYGLGSAGRQRYAEPPECQSCERSDLGQQSRPLTS